MESATYDPNDIVVGDFPLVHQPVVIASGQNLVRGAVLGRITASGKYILSLSAAADGSQVPIALAADTVDATAGDVTAPALFTGEFNGGRLTYGAGHDAATVEASLRGRGQSLFIKTL